MSSKFFYIKCVRKSDRSGNTCRDFLIIQSRGAAALETDRMCISNVILASNVTKYNKVSVVNESSRCSYALYESFSKPSV